jgi:hypothetical protein
MPPFLNLVFSKSMKVILGAPGKASEGEALPGKCRSLASSNVEGECTHK